MANLAINTIINDADTWKYKACFAAKAKYEGEDQPPVGLAYLCLKNFIGAQYEFIEKAIGKKMDVEKWVNEGKIKSYLTSNDRSNFRFARATIQEYKGNRKPEDKPPHLEATAKWLEDNWKAETVYGKEADDAMGIMSAKDSAHTLINHEDKDLWQLEGHHVWYDTGRATTRRIMYVENPGVFFMERSPSGSLELFTTGEYRLYYQMIVGDKSDNIPKVVKEVKGGREFGYGDLEIYEMLKKCQKSKDPLGTFKMMVCDLYERHYQNEPLRYNEIYDLVKILTEESPKT